MPSLPPQSMVIGRREIRWAHLLEPQGSAPGHRRPLLIVQSERFTRSRLTIATVVALAGNVRLVDAPRNLLIPATASGLPRDSVANVTQVLTINRDLLADRYGRCGRPL